MDPLQNCPFAAKLLTENQHLLDALAQELLDHETVSRGKLVTILGERP